MNSLKHIPLWDLTVGIVVDLKFLHIVGRQYDKIKLIRVIQAGEEISKHDLDIYYMPWDERYAWKYKEATDKGYDESICIDLATKHANRTEVLMKRHKNIRYVFEFNKRHYLIIPDHEKTKILINLSSLNFEEIK